jgi:predicted transcriptional regulator
MDNTEETFDELWNRNNVLAKEITMFEDEYSFVLEQAQLYAMQNYAKSSEDVGVKDEDFAPSAPEEIAEIVQAFSEAMKEDTRLPVDRDTLREQVTAMQNELDSRYEEQISVCNKIVEFHEREKFSINWDDRNINFEMFPEYVEVVEKLRAAHAKSTRQTLVMLEKEPA